ncbi:hypothetical protein NMY22_g8871 [Coprinellus aureogranulatus]|nr:hypothetical protein NMY22_g8871 [Coprinellus aureogranulatus]
MAMLRQPVLSLPAIELPSGRSYRAFSKYTLAASPIPVTDFPRSSLHPNHKLPSLEPTRSSDIVEAHQADSSRLPAEPVVQVIQAMARIWEGSLAGMKSASARSLPHLFPNLIVIHHWILDILTMDWRWPPKSQRPRGSTIQICAQPQEELPSTQHVCGAPHGAQAIDRKDRPPRLTPQNIRLVEANFREHLSPWDRRRAGANLTWNPILSRSCAPCVRRLGRQWEYDPGWVERRDGRVPCYRSRCGGIGSFGQWKARLVNDTVEFRSAETSIGRVSADLGSIAIIQPTALITGHLHFSLVVSLSLFSPRNPLHFCTFAIAHSKMQHTASTWLPSHLFPSRKRLPTCPHKMPTVKIPAMQDRDVPPVPGRRERTGHHKIQGMVSRSLESLPKGAIEIDLDKAPSVSQVYSGIEMIDRVVSVPGVETLQCPGSLLDLEWELTGQSEGLHVTVFNEDNIARACSMPHWFIQLMIMEQLRVEDVEGNLDSVGNLGLKPWEVEETNSVKPELRLLATLALEVNEGRKHKTDVSLVNAGYCYSFIEYKTPLAAGHPWWNLFPFTSSGVQYEYLSNLSPPILKILSQCIFYSKGIVERREPHARKVLVALSTPPTKLYYLFIDFTRRTIFISQNVIRVEQNMGTINLSPTADDDRRRNLILKLVDPAAMTVYWESALWFQLVAVYFSFPSLIIDACKADALRLPEERKLPSDLLEKLRAVHGLLGEVPSPSYWVRLRLLKSKLTCSIVGAFGDFVRYAWMKLSWGLLGTRMTLENAHSVQILHQETLIIDNNGSQHCRWMAELGEGVRWENEDGNKEFILYRKQRIFVKLYEPSYIDEFNAEKRVYDELKDLQGFGIPKLYGTGRVCDSDQRFLILSYEGEPLRLWDDRNRVSVKRIAGLLHASGFHHHDLEPRNVVVDERGKVTLVDFGLSQNPCRKSGCKEEREWKDDN